MAGGTPANPAKKYEREPGVASHRQVAFADVPALLPCADGINSGFVSPRDGSASR
jgi:hypothetical protein